MVLVSFYVIVQVFIEVDKKIAISKICKILSSVVVVFKYAIHDKSYTISFNIFAAKDIKTPIGTVTLLKKTHTHTQGINKKQETNLVNDIILCCC